MCGLSKDRLGPLRQSVVIHSCVGNSALRLRPVGHAEAGVGIYRRVGSLNDFIASLPHREEGTDLGRRRLDLDHNGVFDGLQSVEDSFGVPANIARSHDEFL
jgi:hypothetical protein